MVMHGQTADAPHVAMVSYFYDRHLSSPEELLSCYETLTGLAGALAKTGVPITVIQRFGRDAEMVQDGVRYRFVKDPAWKFGGLLDRAARVNRVTAVCRPDLVHIHGLTFARQARRLKRTIPGTPLILQDHGSVLPTRPLTRATLRAALRSVDAVCFTAEEMALPWVQTGLLDAQTPVFALMEGSSRFRLQSREVARALTGLSGNPLCLWVGRLNANKDPLAALRGFEGALTRLPDARLVMVCGSEDLLPQVRAWLAERPAVQWRVCLLKRLPHDALEPIYNSADLFVHSSHREGSGYAVLEALACGVVPVVTDIPSLRRMTGRGEVGRLWPVGDAGALAQALVEAASSLTPETPVRIRRFFEDHWSYEAIGREAIAIYTHLLQGTQR